MIKIYDNSLKSDWNKYLNKNDNSSVWHHDNWFDIFEKLFYRESQGGLMYNTKPKPVKDYGFDPGLMSLEETEKMLRKDLKEKEILENFDVTDRTKNADGGLINILKL